MAVAFHDNEDGTYECEWQASVSGVYLVSVMLHGEHIAGSPWAARAIAPGADPSQCRLRAGSAPVHAVAGLPACFDIEFFDALGEGVAMEPIELETVLKTAEACAIRTGGSKGVKTPERTHLLLTAHEDGSGLPERRCRASVSVEAAGDYMLHVLMQPNHQPLLGSPIMLHVSPAAPSAAHTVLEATPAERRLLAGQRRTFTIRTRDAWGNNCNRGGAKIALRVPEVVHCAVADLENGLYEVEWSSKTAGLYSVEVLLDGVPLTQGSPLTLAVEPNELCVRKTTVSGELTRATAGDRAIVRVHGVDEWGNAVLPSSDVGFGISLRGKDSRRPVEMRCGDGPQSLLATDHYVVGGAAGGATGEKLPRATLHGYWLSDGVFELMYTCSGAGGFLMHLWYRDAHGIVHEMANSPQALEVTPAAADARGSTLFEGSTNLHHSVLPAGTRLQAYAQVADRFGNPREASSGELDVWLETPRARQRIRPTTFNSDRGIAEAEAPSGMCELAEDLGIAGHYTLNVMVLGEHVIGSPIELDVVPAVPDGEHSILVPPPYAAIAHEPATFVVQPRDKWGNAPPVKELQQAVSLGAVVARVDGPTRPKCAVRARNDGSLDISVLAQLSGDYRLHVWVGGTQLPACPFPIKVHANHSLASAAMTTSLAEVKTSPPRGHMIRAASPPPVEDEPPNSPVFSPRGAYPGGLRSPTRTLVSSASWAARGPSTPRSRKAAAAAAPKGVSLGAAGVKETLTLASPRTEGWAKPRSRIVRPQSAVTLGPYRATAHTGASPAGRPHVSRDPARACGDCCARGRL